MVQSDPVDPACFAVTQQNSLGLTLVARLQLSASLTIFHQPFRSVISAAIIPRNL